MHVDVAGVVPTFGTDTYVNRRGRMVGKVLGSFRWPTARAASLTRASWSRGSTKLPRWVAVGDRPVPADGSAVWHFANGDFVSVRGRFLPSALAFNVPPASGSKQAAGDIRERPSG